MAGPASVNWEVSVILPLGVVGSQLQRIESELRQLTMKTVDLSPQADHGRPAALVVARLEAIGEQLDAIARLVAAMQADVGTRPSGARED